MTTEPRSALGDLSEYWGKFLHDAGIDVMAAKDEVVKQLRLLSGAMSEEEWITLYREAVVRDVMES